MEQGHLPGFCFFFLILHELMAKIITGLVQACLGRSTTPLRGSLKVINNKCILTLELMLTHHKFPNFRMEYYWHDFYSDFGSELQSGQDDASCHKSELEDFKENFVVWFFLSSRFCSIRGYQTYFEPLIKLKLFYFVMHLLAGCMLFCQFLFWMTFTYFYFKNQPTSHFFGLLRMDWPTLEHSLFRFIDNLGDPRLFNVWFFLCNQKQASIWCLYCFKIGIPEVMYCIPALRLHHWYWRKFSSAFA